jgi:hypothetical protein
VNAEELAAKLKQEIVRERARQSTALVCPVLEEFLADVQALDVGAARDTAIPDAERWISVAAAARLIGMSREWVYENKRTLGWVKKCGKRSLRCDAAQLRRWCERGRAA